jgi:hypothetical protein
MSDPLHQHCLEVAEAAYLSQWNDGEELPDASCIANIAAALETELRAERERVLEAMQGVEHTVEFYLKREIESPANHQEFAREASEKLDKFRDVIRALKGTGK